MLRPGIGAYEQRKPTAQGGCKRGETPLHKRPKTSRMDGRMTGRLFLGLLLLTVTVTTGCGRKSGLDTPYEAAVQARKDAEKARQPLPPEPTPPPQDRRFILDGLID